MLVKYVGGSTHKTVAFNAIVGRDPKQALDDLAAETSEIGFEARATYLTLYDIDGDIADLQCGVPCVHVFGCACIRHAPGRR